MIPHWVYDAIPPVATIVAAMAGLAVRDVVRKSTQSLVESIQEVGKKIDVHLAEDAIIHKDHDRRITRLEEKTNG